MKKRILSILLCVITVFSSVCLLASCDTDLLSDRETTGLYFFPLPDGSFGVKAGTALYLESIALPSQHNGRNVTEILPCAFDGAYNLKSINIPNHVTKIGEAAFSGCVKLTSIVIPETVTSIDKSAFISCVSLTEIRFKGTEEQWNAISKGSDWNSNTGNYTVTYNYTGE